MSISAAPAATASRVSWTLTASDVWPEGKPVDSEPTATPVPRSASAATGTSAGYTHTAAHDGISGRDGSGTTALAHRWRTLPEVSEPSSVVRSIIDVAMRMPSRLADVLIERLPSAAARSSTPTRLTGVSVRLMGMSLTRFGHGLRALAGPAGHRARRARAVRRVPGGVLARARAGHLSGRVRRRPHRARLAGRADPE